MQTHVHQSRRLPEPIKAVHKAWGPHVKKLVPPFGFLEGHQVEAAECAVHELCHAALLGVFVPYGRCHSCNVSDYVEAACNLDPWLSDKNEVQTLAAESLVLRELGLFQDVGMSTLLDLGLKNLQLFNPHHQRNRLHRCIRRARNTPKVRRAAAAVVEFIRNGKGKCL